MLLIAVVYLHLYVCGKFCQRSADDAGGWIWGVMNKGMCCSSQVHDWHVFFLFSSTSTVRTNLFHGFVRMCGIRVAHTYFSATLGKILKRCFGAAERWSSWQSPWGGYKRCFLLFFPHLFRWGCCCGWSCSCLLSPRLSDRSPCSQL